LDEYWIVDLFEKSMHWHGYLYLGILCYGTVTVQTHKATLFGALYLIHGITIFLIHPMFDRWLSDSEDINSVLKNVLSFSRGGQGFDQSSILFSDITLKGSAIYQWYSTFGLSMLATLDLMIGLVLYFVLSNDIYQPAKSASEAMTAVLGISLDDGRKAIMMQIARPSMILTCVVLYRRAYCVQIIKVQLFENLVPPNLQRLHE